MNERSLKRWLVASLVLSTRYRPRPVLVGVAAAFAASSAAPLAGG